MPLRNPDLHGNAPDKCSVALLIIDAINDFEWSGGRSLIDQAIVMAQHIRSLKDHARDHNVPVIYVNDNFGRWKSDFKAVVDHVIDDDTLGKPVAEILRPNESDYFVLKPKHSGFYSTTLDTLLEYLGTQTVVLTGVQTNICVLFTANEAYMRDLGVVVVPDCCLSESAEHHRYAVEQMRAVLKASVILSNDINFDSLKYSVAKSRTV